jgi:hypothetical protein
MLEPNVNFAHKQNIRKHQWLWNEVRLRLQKLVSSRGRGTEPRVDGSLNLTVNHCLKFSVQSTKCCAILPDVRVPLPLLLLGAGYLLEIDGALSLDSHISDK